MLSGIVKLLCAIAASAVLLLAATVSSAAGGPPTCTHAQLRVTHGPLNGTAGAFHWPIRFRNVSGSACTERGFARVRSLKRGHVVGAPAAHDHSTPVRTIRLAANGGIASAVFTQTDVGVFPRSRCHPTRATALRVRPPGQTRAFVIRLHHRVCTTSPGGSDSRVRAVVRGSSGL
jgi:Domain of unknown function (DUF4232)